MLGRNDIANFELNFVARVRVSVLSEGAAHLAHMPVAVKNQWAELVQFRSDCHLAIIAAIARETRMFF